MIFSKEFSAELSIVVYLHEDTLHIDYYANLSLFIMKTKMTTIDEPLDLVKFSIDERVYVKCKGDRELRGKLHAFDKHCNMVLGDVEETITSVVIDDDTQEEIVQYSNRKLDMLFVRGDSVILLSPPPKTV